jgi:hypothetical protein
MAVSITEYNASNDVNLPVTKGPLANLQAGKDAGGITLKYPSDLGNDNGPNQKRHWVNFAIKEIKPSQSFVSGAGELKLPNAGGLLTEIGTKLTSTEGILVAGAVGGIAGVVSAEVVGNVLTKTGNLLTNGLTISQQYVDARQYISLYMPDTLNATYNANYEEMSLTQDLGALLTTLRAADSAAGNLGENGDFSSISSALSSLGNSIGTDPNVSQALSGLLDVTGAQIPGINTQNLTTLLQKAQGFALNPQLQMVYRGTGLRTFQLSFTFTPKSKEESYSVNNIINRFRFYAAPSLSGIEKSSNSSSNENMFLIPPAVFNLSFFINGTESTILPKYGDCVLESIDINNAPNGLAVYDNGSMVQTQLNLSFKEMDILTRDKINNNEAR